MIFLEQSANPMDHMSGMWSFLLVILAVTAVLLLLLRPVMKWITDRKTKSIIEGSGVADLTGPDPNLDEIGGDADGDRGSRRRKRGRGR